jgi:hypothetical protein
MVNDEHKFVHLLTPEEFVSSQAHKIALPGIKLMLIFAKECLEADCPKEHFLTEFDQKNFLLVTVYCLFVCVGGEV